MSQFAFNLSLPPVFSAENFILSDCNRNAWQMVTAWPAWPSHALLLQGPEGSGKSHLGRIWSGKSCARTVAASALHTLDMAGVKGHWLIENIEEVREERLLLHAFNAIRERGDSLLLTSRQPAMQLPLTLPDLNSRLRALPSAIIRSPDDAMLAGAMRKQFADRQLKVDDDVIDYLLPRMERSLRRVRDLVDRLDTRALAAGRKISVPFARRLLETEESS